MILVLCFRCVIGQPSQKPTHTQPPLLYVTHAHILLSLTGRNVLDHQQINLFLIFQFYLSVTFKTFSLVLDIFASLSHRVPVGGSQFTAVLLHNSADSKQRACARAYIHAGWLNATFYEKRPVVGGGFCPYVQPYFHREDNIHSFFFNSTREAHSAALAQY